MGDHGDQAADNPADCGRTYQAILSLSERVGGVEKSLARIEGVCTGCQATVEANKVAIFGNGSRGLKSRVAVLSHVVLGGGGVSLGLAGLAVLVAIARAIWFGEIPKLQ